MNPDVPVNPDDTNTGQGPQYQDATQEDFVIRQDVRLVRADVQVVQKQQIVHGLLRSDFILKDEGIQTEITDFGMESDPLDILMLLDVSGSMTAYLYEVSRTAGNALEKLDADDRVSVMLFSKQTKVLHPLEKEREPILTTLRSLARFPGMGAGTAINAAIMDAVKVFREDAEQRGADPRRRRAILILTDNWGLNYKLPDRVVLRELHAENISLHAIVVGRVQKPQGKWGELMTDELAEEIDFSPANVFRLAEETGGDVFLNLKKDQGFAEMLSRIRSRYSIYFKPAAATQPGEFRNITVELSPEAIRKHRRAEVRVRTGYLVQ